MKTLAASLVLVATLAPAALAEVGLYSNNFESGPLGPEWSSNSVLTSTTESTFTRFNGRYSSSYTELTVPYPGSVSPPHGLTAPGGPGGQGEALRFRLSFDFYAIDSWDGNANYINYLGEAAGPDRFAVFVNQVKLFDETIANRNYTQSYREPDLGRYNIGFIPELHDSIYRNIVLEFEVPAGNPIVIRWQDMGLGSTGMLDETWGIDNVNLGYTVVPAPGSLALIGAGLLVCRRRRG